MCTHNTKVAAHARPAQEGRPIGRPNASIQKERRLVPWIWEGVVAEQAVTLLSAPEKIGNTTPLSLLLDRRRAGGQLLGRTVYPGHTEGKTGVS
jgi:hypothetical protein